jgi:hypothetical protein
VTPCPQPHWTPSSSGTNSDHRFVFWCELLCYPTPSPQ